MMKKTAVAAFAALVVAEASAQQPSSVTIYGIVDAGVQVLQAQGSPRVYNLVSGGRSGSRLGFRGNEDLGGGLRAVFTLEQGINLDAGTLGQGGRAWGRQAFVGLRGDFGTVALGRIAAFSSGTGSFDMFGDVDPLATSYGIGGVGSTMSSAAGLRGDNTLLYQSPEWSGWQYGAAHSLQINGAELAPRGANLHLSSLAVKYRAGPVLAVLTYDIGNNPSGAADEKHLQFGASYDFGMLKLHAAYAAETDPFSTALNVSGTTNGADAKSYMVGLTAPLGRGLLRASYQSRDGQTKGGENRDLRVIALAYEYKLSQRSMLYMALADSDGRNTLNNNPSYERRVYTAGVNHRF